MFKIKMKREAHTLVDRQLVCFKRGETYEVGDMVCSLLVNNGSAEYIGRVE